jgi:hypothetical protein
VMRGSAESQPAVTGEAPRKARDAA